MQSKPGRDLPIGAVFTEAVDTLLDRQREFARALLLPLLWLTIWAAVCAPVVAGLGPLGLINFVVYLYFSVPIMVATYRLALGDADAETWTLWPRWSVREMRVLGWMLTIVVGFFALQMLLVLALGSVLRSGPMMKLLYSNGASALWWMIPLAALILIMTFYVCSRLWILFPGASMDEGRNPVWVWETTRGYGLRLFALWLPLCLATVLFTLAVFTTLGSTGWLPSFLSSAFTSVAMVVQNVIVAVAYHRLVGAPRGAPSEVAFLEEYGLV